MAITLVVPVYKIEEKYLRKCLDSIQNQTSSEWEAILIDDGSPDGCGDICDEYATRDSRFRAVHQRNQGVSVARNRGIDCAQTDWITFVDPDDWLDLKMVEIINERLEINKPDILAFGYAREFNNLTRPEKLLDKSQKINSELLHRMRLAPLNRLMIDEHVYQYTINAIWNKVYRVEFLNRNNIRFEPMARKGQDRIFNMHALDKTDNVFYLNVLLYHYRNDNDNSIVNRYNPDTVKNSQIAISLMNDWILMNNKGKEYKDMLYCWTCTRLQEYMRLYYFNSNNHEKYSEVKRKLNELLDSEPYTTALRNVNYTILTREEKIFLFFIKKKQLRICKLLILGREILKKIKNQGWH